MAEADKFFSSDDIEEVRLSEAQFSLRSASYNDEEIEAEGQNHPGNEEGMKDVYRLVVQEKLYPNQSALNVNGNFRSLCPYLQRR